ncbi:hypothetical protein GGR34_000518 [Microvirga flocculans]|uniref:Lectin-like protein BA14k n=1 Tax=Microvirga flocculans TaxID=217168 RepID=A0A7W6ICI0_9HYPH|nr:BA14K family protein [Microvirga flocculans]MBB4038889.1 hypothetical protein [Microvirga flocculans]
MRKFILTALATAVLVPASLLAGSASAQVAPSTTFQQLLERDQITAVYAARGGRGGGAAMRRPAGMHAGAYRGGAYRGAYRGGAYRAGVYRGNAVRAGAYRGPYAGRYYGGRYYRPYAAYGRPYYRGAYRPYYGGGYYRPYYGGGYSYPYGYGAAAAAGALIGGAIASQPMVTGSVGSAAAYCAQRYRSYNPATGTFTGYDGRQHPCP